MGIVLTLVLVLGVVNVQYPTLLYDIVLDNKVPDEYHVDFEIQQGVEDND